MLQQAWTTALHCGRCTAWSLTLTGLVPTCRLAVCESVAVAPTRPLDFSTRFPRTMWSTRAAPPPGAPPTVLAVLL
eukprot:7021768-Prymnesium_polylepis.1